MLLIISSNGVFDIFISTILSGLINLIASAILLLVISTSILELYPLSFSIVIPFHLQDLFFL